MILHPWPIIIPKDRIIGLTLTHSELWIRCSLFYRFFIYICTHKNKSLLIGESILKILFNILFRASSYYRFRCIKTRLRTAGVCFEKLRIGFIAKANILIIDGLHLGWSWRLLKSKMSLTLFRSICISICHCRSLFWSYCCSWSELALISLIRDMNRRHPVCSSCLCYGAWVFSDIIMIFTCIALGWLGKLFQQ